MSSDVPALNFVEPDETKGPTKVCLYGPAGSGKTVAACSAPGPIVVLNAEGPSALRFSRRLYGNSKLREIEFKSSGTLDAFLYYVRNSLDGEQTVVVDSVGEIHKTLLREIGGRSPQIQHYGKANILVEELVRALRDLSLHVVLVCHEQIDDSEEGGATRRPLTGGTKLPETVMGMMDVVAYCSVVEGKKEGDPPSYVAQLLQARGRRAKDRSGALGAWRVLDLSEWVDRIDEALVPDDLPWEQAKS